MKKHNKKQACHSLLIIKTEWASYRAFSASPLEIILCEGHVSLPTIERGEFLKDNTTFEQIYTTKMGFNLLLVSSSLHRVASPSSLHVLCSLSTWIFLGSLLDLIPLCESEKKKCIHSHARFPKRPRKLIYFEGLRYISLAPRSIGLESKEMPL